MTAILPLILPTIFSTKLTPDDYLKVLIIQKILNCKCYLTLTAFQLNVEFCADKKP